MYITYMYEYRLVEINFTMTDILLQNCSAARIIITLLYINYSVLPEFGGFQNYMDAFFNIIMKI